MKKLFIIILSIGSTLILSGCGSSNGIPESQEISFLNQYSMQIHPGFIQTIVQNNNIKSKTLAAYAFPPPDNSIFEKNIIISETDLGNSSSEKFVEESIAGIQESRGGYNKENIKKKDFDCNGKNIQGQQHVFSIERGNLQTTQRIYFVQYFFAKEEKIIIIVSSTDSSDDIGSLEGYIDSLQCINI